MRPAFDPTLLIILQVLAAQSNGFRDPILILAGSVPVSISGAPLMIFLKMPNPNIQFWTGGWTATLDIYSQVGLVTLARLS